MPGGRGLGIHVSRIGCLATSGALLGALIVCAPFAGAERKAAPDRSAHLLLVPGEGQAAAALAGSDARVIARYGAFSLVEAAGADERTLREAGADRRDDMRDVALPGGSVDPLRERESLAARGAREPAEAQLVVQFVGPVKDDWLARVRATGARIVQYVAQNGYVVHARGREIDRLAALVGTDRAVRAVTRVRAADKLVGVVGRGGGPRQVTVDTLSGSDGTAARRNAANAGPDLRTPSTVDGIRTQFLTLTGSEAAELASDPSVVTVSPYGAPRLLDERVSQIVVGNLDSMGRGPAAPGYLGWHDARFSASDFEDFVIDVADEGLDTGSAGSPAHPDLRVNGSPSASSRIAYINNFTDDPSGADCGGHGTNVASIAAGFGASGQDAQGYRLGMGVAPRALIGGSKIFDCEGNLLLDETQLAGVMSQAYADGARISNHSWGNGDNGRYSRDSREYDRLVRDSRYGVSGDQEMVVVFAAGNEGDGLDGPGNEGYGSVSSPATAKNVISVGASEGVRGIGGADGCGVPDAGADNVNDILGFSSRGPTNDLRMKPDLVSPGTHVVGAASRFSGYTGEEVCNAVFGSLVHNLASGTSQAAPGVSGASSLLRAWYGQTQGTPPSPAMTKAILVNTASDLAGGDNGLGAAVETAPNADQGWGRVRAARVLDGTAREFLDQSELLTATGQRITHAYSIQDNGPVKVTLAFTDAPGAADSGVNAVNDLDLVVRQGGRTYSGNVISGGRSVTGGDADPRNNVESVVLPAGASGRLSVEVVAKGIAGDGVPDVPGATDQDFALVVSNANELSEAAVLASDTVSADDPLGDNDDVIEPGEPLNLRVALRNAGTDPAPSPNGVATGSGGLSLSGTGTWGTISPGASAPQNTPYTGSVSPAVTCGTELTGTMALNDGSAPAFSVATGAASAPITRTQSTPVQIQDNSPAGVTSTMFVPSRGVIKDLDVRLNITHPLVGDLRVDLIAPDGTVIRLVEHPGGPDNEGDNLTNLVLGDQGPSIATGTAPYTGTYRPLADSLARLNGKQQRGTWTLRVRDLYEGFDGTLVSWSTIARTALCNYDTVPPATSITSAPPATDTSTSAAFSFGSPDPGAVYDCRLDGAPYEPCDDTRSLSGLALGSHRLDVVAIDGSGNVDPSPASYSWSVVAPPVQVPPPVPPPTPPDRSAPSVTLSSPARGAVLDNRRPTLSGRAGTAAGDSGSVTVRLWDGGSASGGADRTLSARRSAGGGWSASPGSDLADGLWTARAQQSDASGNTGVSAGVTFRIDTTRPEFALLPVEADRALARAGKVAMLAGCGSACRVTAELKGGRGRKRDPVLAGLDRSLAAPGTRWLALKPTRSGRSRLRRADKATLRVRISAGSRTLNVARRVVLTRVNLAREARRGLRFAAACGEPCTVSSRLTMASREARRLEILARGRARVTLGSGRAGASTKPAALTLKLGSAARKKLLRARRAKVTLDTTVRAEHGPEQSSSRRMTLRR